MQLNDLKLFIITRLSPKPGLASKPVMRLKSCRKVDSLLLFSASSITLLTGLLFGLSISFPHQALAEISTAGNAVAGKSSAPVEAVLSPAADVVNLQFQGREAWDYDLERPNHP